MHMLMFGTFWKIPIYVILPNFRHLFFKRIIVTEHQDELEDPMASVSIRVRNEEGDDFVVSPSDVVDNINEVSYTFEIIQIHF